jgi:hypothetical protein
MNCERIRNLLPDYSVEILDGRTHQAVRQHLTQCADCRAEQRALDDAVALVEQYGVRQPPPGLFNAVRNRIEAGDLVRERPVWWAWFNTGPARAAAMGMAMAAVAVGLILPTGGPMITHNPYLDVHATAGMPVTSNALASSIRQHAMSSVEGPLTDRVAWEAMAQLVTLNDEAEERNSRDQ